jgi:hypothetical protein
MIFGKIRTDSVVQVFDKIRIDCTKSFWVTNVGISNVEIRPEASESFYQVINTSEPENTDYWFLDWAYSTAGTKQITLRITYGVSSTVIDFNKSIQVITEAEDNLFSQDADLIGYQHDIMKYLPEGRSSWNFVHRVAQREILDYLDEKGVVNEDQSKITKDQIVDLTEVRAWSTFKTLRIIYESMSNAPDDFFFKRAEHWSKHEESAKLRCVTRLDFNKDGVIDNSKEVQSNNFIVARRG